MKDLTKTEKSNCCNAPVTTNCADEGTCCFICTKCDKPCSFQDEKGSARKIAYMQKEKSRQIEEVKEQYRKEVTPAYKIYDETILPFQIALGEATVQARTVLDKTMEPAWERLQAKLKEIEEDRRR